MAQSILIVEDDPAQRRYLQTIVASLGYRTLEAGSGREAIDLLTATPAEPIDLVILDLVMPEVDGFAVLDRVHPTRPELPVIVLTMQGGVDTVVKVMRTGAVDFIIKPASPERLQVSVENALKITALSDQVSRLSRRAIGRTNFDDIVLRSVSMGQTVDLARRAAASNIPILIEGESGVGKELIARAIQGSSERSGKPFVTVNCGAIPENLVESILFGHEKGSFTGADQRQIGKFQEADGGTVFLDEIAELRADLQVKLLRALQEGEIDTVGGKRPVKVDVRVMSATNQNLAQLVSEGAFRQDLFYRLNVFPILVPPLRERRDDISALVDHFIAEYAASESKSVRGASPEAHELLLNHDWPGNVRQLENAVFRAVVLCDSDVLNVIDFPQIAQAQGIVPAATPSMAPSGATGMPEDNGYNIPIRSSDGGIRTLKDVEDDMIRAALKHCRGQMSEVARQLEIGRSTLYRKVRELGLDADDFKQRS